MRWPAISVICTVFSRGRIVVAPALAFAAVAACSFTTHLDELDDGQCAAGLKACNRRCESVGDPTVGCAGDGCSPCFVSHGTADCSARTQDCAISTCNANYDDCNHTYGDGCEAALLNDPLNCGRCDNPCNGTVAHGKPGCASGRCVVGQCDSGWADCNGLAADGCETACAPQVPGTVQTCTTSDAGTGWTCQ
jgi:hypothetical protein